jgi:glucan phosphoethanolaminetransferase (alkaline phosphatase superfamily)
MEILKSLESYTLAQKMVGTSFMIIGVILLLVAISLHIFTNQTTLSNGLKIGSLICGILILVGGFGYKNFSSKTQLKQIEVYKKSKKNFFEQEQVRMEKVEKDYPIYQIFFGAFIVFAVVIVLLTKRPFWHGIAFSVMILFTSVMIIEAFSHKSITDYAKKIIRNSNSL